ncbi:hypothetical protein AAVH_35221, partial [Aphelenchoides avenae]
MKRSASVQYADDAKKMRISPTLQKTLSDERKIRCRPAEVLLDIVHCVDFNTLVALRFASQTFHRIVQKSADVLAKQLRMELIIDDGSLILAVDENCREFHYDSSIPFGCEAAMRRIASHVGCHRLTSLSIANDWRRLHMERLLCAAPVLGFIETLEIDTTDRSSQRITSVEDVNRFTRQFPRLRRLRLDAPGKPVFDWSAFLRSEGALELPEFAGTIYTFRAKARYPVPSEFDFLRYCFDCTRLADDVGKFVKVPFQIDASRSFPVTSLR